MSQSLLSFETSQPSIYVLICFKFDVASPLIDHKSNFLDNYYVFFYQKMKMYIIDAYVNIGAPLPPSGEDVSLTGRMSKNFKKIFDQKNQFELYSCFYTFQKRLEINDTINME